MKLQLLRAIHLTHHEAVMRNEIVTLCHSKDQKTCGGNWKDGYVIVANKTVLFSFINESGQGEIYWRAFPIHQDQLDYLPSGRLKAENGSFWCCVATEKTPRWVIVINQAGRAREIMSTQASEIFKNGMKQLNC